MAQPTPGIAGRRRAGSGRGVPELLNPAQVAQMLGVAESDVHREPRVGRSQGQADRHAVARHARRGRRLPARMTRAIAVDVAGRAPLRGRAARRSPRCSRSAPAARAGSRAQRARAGRARATGSRSVDAGRYAGQLEGRGREAAAVGARRRAGARPWRGARAPLGALVKRTILADALRRARSRACRDGDYAVVIYRVAYAQARRRRARRVHARARGRRRVARDRLRRPLTWRDPTAALAKFACPACGGEAVWNPAKQKLVCPFCGTESPARLGADGAHRRARPRRRAARHRRRRARLAGATSAQVRCQSCNAISVLDPARQAQNCQFCGSAQLVPYEETKPAFRPESVLPFTVSEGDARDGIRRGTARCGSRRRRSSGAR